jgi:hypothetical protein
MNVKKGLYVGVGIFLLLVLVAIYITDRLNPSLIISDPYRFIEKFFSQWSLALSAAGTIILALTIFSHIYENRRREERDNRQAIYALHDEIHWNLRPIITLRFAISERLRYQEEHNVILTEEAPFQLLDSRVFQDMRSRGQLYLLENLRMDVVFCYTLIDMYNKDGRFKPKHLELLATLYEELDKAIRNLEAKFKFLPHYVKYEDERQQPESESAGQSSTTQERVEVANSESATNGPTFSTIREQALNQGRIAFAICLLLLQAAVVVAKLGTSTTFPVFGFTIPLAQKWIDGGLAIAFLAWSLIALSVANCGWLARRSDWIQNFVLRLFFHMMATLAVLVGWPSGVVAVVQADLGVWYAFLLFTSGLIVVILLLISVRHIRRERGSA